MGVQSISGYVKEIGFFHPTFTTRDNKTVYIPNKNVIAGKLANLCKTDFIRLGLILGISYVDDMEKAKKVLEERVNSVDGVFSQPPPVVAVSELADSSVNFSVLPCENVDDAPRVCSLVTEQVKLRFDQEGMSIPFPQRDIHLYQSDGVSSLN